ncbi:MAG: peptide deformylase [Thermodesulfobacteriota bacterium]
MPFKTVLKYPDPFLKTKAEPVEEFDAGTEQLITDMIDTMYAAKGIGLAAVQIGVARRVIVLDVPGDDEEKRERGDNLMALVNPEIVSSDGTMVYEEGCLSVPGFTADVTRAARVVVRALDRNGRPVEIRAEGLHAVALQHEIDHLDGILFIDRLSRLKREIIKRKIKKSIESQDRAL